MTEQEAKEAGKKHFAQGKQCTPFDCREVDAVIFQSISGFDNLTRMRMYSKIRGAFNAGWQEENNMAQINLLPLRVLQSNAGFYIGTADNEGPVDRKSLEYWPTAQQATEALALGDWTNREYKISKDEDTGAICLSKQNEFGETSKVLFGGIPAIQNYAIENPEIPERVIHELLAREGGYTGLRGTRDVDNDFVLMHPDSNRVIIRLSVDNAWAEAAGSAVRHFEITDKLSKSSVPNPDSYHEVIADIAFVAGHLAAKGKLEIKDSRELMSNIVTWSKEFEAAFDKDRHGDDYMELVDEYAEACLLEGGAVDILERMRQPDSSCRP